MPVTLVVAVLLSAPLQELPPLSFLGFRAGMPMARAIELIRAGGGALSCRGSSDPRIRECTGSLPARRFARPLTVLISSIHDSAAVIVLSGAPPAELARGWIEDLTLDFGEPDHKVSPPSQHTWQWVRRRRMLRVNARTAGDSLEASVILTHGPLLDGLGPAKRTKPD
jgi:hypothetical protein